MRSPRLLASLLALAWVGLLILPAHAGEEPADASDAVGWDAERFWFAELIPPGKAWPRLREATGKVPYAERRALQKARAEEYLAIWEKTEKGDLSPDDRLGLYHMLAIAERHADAVTAVRPLLLDTQAERTERDQAAIRIAGMLTHPKLRAAVEAARIEALVSDVIAYLDDRIEDDGAKTRGNLHLALGRYYAGKHDAGKAVEHDVKAALMDAGVASRAGRAILTTMMSSGWEQDGYPDLRRRSKELFDILRKIAEKHLETFGPDDDSREKRMAEAAVKGLRDREAPLALLGEPAPAWTLDEAFGDVETLEDLRGKVVVLDFWATWCPWCIKSFPAIRDLLRDYEGKGLVVVGVTAHASSVYAERFDLDDDLKGKAEPGARPKAAATLDRGRPARDPSIPMLEEEAYRAKEKEVLRTFIANHEMTWPVVMIDKAEPGPKYGLQGWPHAVVLDRQGRVRYFKVGALLRDRPAQVAHFRAVLDALLAEEAPEATE